jgi:hypothetical protein
MFTVNHIPTHLYSCINTTALKKKKKKWRWRQALWWRMTKKTNNNKKQYFLLKWNWDQIPYHMQCEQIQHKAVGCSRWRDDDNQDTDSIQPIGKTRSTPAKELAWLWPAKEELCYVNHWHYKSSSITRGSSTAALILRKKVTASRPSTSLWS